MAIHELTDENFEEKVLKDTSSWVIRFTAEWCGRLLPH